MEPSMINVAIIVGSTRPGRKALAVAEWVGAIAAQRADARFEILDLADFRLPLLDEPMPPSMGRVQHGHTRAWGGRVASFDAFVFVAPEYNHGPSAALKNAIDFLYAEWNDKAAGFVTYGGAGGVRAAEQLRLILAELQVATVRAQVALSLFSDFEDFTTFVPAPGQAQRLSTMLDQLVAWGGALSAMRAAASPRRESAQA
jgi:NAD(P)H-dependent FMN reductase